MGLFVDNKVFVVGMFSKFSDTLAVFCYDDIFLFYQGQVFPKGICKSVVLTRILSPLGIIILNVSYYVNSSLANMVEEGFNLSPCICWTLKPLRLFLIPGIYSSYTVKRISITCGVDSDGYANHMRETLAAMDDETFALYLKYHFATRSCN